MLNKFKYLDQMVNDAKTTKLSQEQFMKSNVRPSPVIIEHQYWFHMQMNHDRLDGSDKEVVL